MTNALWISITALIAGLVIYDLFWRYQGRFDLKTYLKASNNEIFLTFDDGPDVADKLWGDTADEVKQAEKVILGIDPGWDFTASIDENLLRTLDEFDAKAIFFIQGQQVDGNKEAHAIVKKMMENGHVIGNHFYSHHKYFQLSKTECINEISKTDHILEKLTGHKPVLYRPPYGLWSLSLSFMMWANRLLNHYLFPLGWSHCTFDWNEPAISLNESKIRYSVNNMIAMFHRAQQPCVVLQHDVWVYCVLFTRIMLERIKSDVSLRIGNPEHILAAYADARRRPFPVEVLKYYLCGRLAAITNRVKRIRGKV